MARSTTRQSTTTARACRSIRKSSRAGCGRPRTIAPQAMKERRAELGLAYGRRARAVHRPVLARHGRRRRRSRCSSTAATGARSTPRMFSHVARGLNAHGVDGRGRRLRSLPAGDHRRHHRGDPARAACSSGSAPASASWSTAIPPAAISPPPCWRPTGTGSIPRRRPTWCRPPTRSPACSISRRSSSVAMNQDLRLDASEARARSRRCSGRRPRAAAFDAVVGGARIERVPAPEPDHRGRLGQGRRRHPLLEVAGTNHFTVLDALTRSEERDGAAAGGAGEQAVKPAQAAGSVCSLLPLERGRVRG